MDNETLERHHIDQIIDNIVQGNTIPYCKLDKICRGNKTLHKYTFDRLMKETASGNKYAQFQLGCLWMFELHTEQNYRKALEYFKLSSDQDYGYAQAWLGSMYLYGFGIEKDVATGHNYYEKAIEYIKLNIDKDGAFAKGFLGFLYEHGLGVEQDYNEAFKYYKLGADGGCDDAQLNLAMMYEKEVVVKKNIQEAIKYYKLASEQGNELAQFILAEIYEKGLAAEKNYQEAFKYYKLCADRNNYAQKRLKAILDNLGIISKIVLVLFKKIDRQKRMIDEKNMLAAHLKFAPY